MKIEVDLDDKLGEDLSQYAAAQGVSMPEFLRRIVLKEFRPAELFEVLG